jgi:hypothetical protein
VDDRGAGPTRGPQHDMLNGDGHAASLRLRDR